MLCHLTSLAPVRGLRAGLDRALSLGLGLSLGKGGNLTVLIYNDLAG
jgi:hypothetical protein